MGSGFEVFMKNLFIEVKYEGEMNFTKELLDKTPKRLVLCTSIQYIDFLDQAKQFLEKAEKEVQFFQSRHGQYPGQILGCDIFKFNPEKEFDAFVYIGDGLFHPTALLFSNEKPVYLYCPRGETLKELDGGYLSKLKKKQMGRFAKFLESKNVGVLVTRKPGQNQSLAVEKFREEMVGRGKNVFVFLTDSIDISKLEDFNFIDSWINTGCPRIVQDFNCLNLRDLKEIGFFSGDKAAF